VSLHPGYRIVRLRNGAHSVHSLAHQETFHPVVGPAAEAEALYLHQLKIADRLRARSQSRFVIWDVGLGAAANVLTVLRATREIPSSVQVISFDHTAEPLQFALEHADDLGYLAGFEPWIRELLQSHTTAFQQGAQHVCWDFFLADFPGLLERAHPADEDTDAGTHHPDEQMSGGDLRSSGRVAPANPTANERSPSMALPSPHAILFDAFSPAKNPAMWTLPLFCQIFRFLRPDRPCSLATYSRSTLLRVTLLLAGFFVGSGAATGEKEETTIAANSLELIPQPLTPRWLQSARRSSSAEPLTSPVYRQAPLSNETWDRLVAHPQFTNL
jgi:tRNA U34 5-methylaminomethyl-2-thiouridine-forming methyltransferase MnmC